MILPINLAWVVSAAFLALLMHAGFALFATGMCRAKNASHTMSMNFLVYALGMTGFFICGYAFMCGGSAEVGGVEMPGHWLIQIRGWGFLGGRGFLLNGGAFTAATAMAFLFMLVRMDVTATIPLGAMAERWRFKSFFFFSLLVGAFIFPVFGCWVWGGGWISQLGTKLGWGHGGVDYAGSAVIHLQGGMIALAGTLALGTRIGKYDLRGRPRPILGHHVPMAILGTMILAIGWLALNAGASLVASDGRVAVIAVNTVLSSAAGAMAACGYMWFVYGKPDPSMMCNGMLSGMVAVSAACAFVTPDIAFLIGAVAGVLVVWSVFFLEHRGVDDPVGAISVHGVNGLWGVLALGLFADGTYGQGYNGVGAGNRAGVAGFFYGDSKQLLSQCVMGLSCCVWSFVAATIAFWVLSKLVGPNRVRREVEMAGLDIPEMGVPAYPDINLNAAMAEPAMRAVSPEPRPATMPADGQRRFSLVIEGIAAGELIKAWSTLCQTSAEAPAPEFMAVYPFVTTVTGNRFRFRGGDPNHVKENLTKLFQSVLKNNAIQAKIES